MQYMESNAMYIPLRRQTTGAPKGTACTFNVVHEPLLNIIAIICAFTGTIYSHRHSNGTTDFRAAAVPQSGAAAVHNGANDSAHNGAHDRAHNRANDRTHIGAHDRAHIGAHDALMFSLRC